MNLLIAFVLLFVLAFGVSEPTEEVGTIESGSPAAAHLRSGDRLVSIDGERGDAAEMASALNEHECAGEPRGGCRAETAAGVVIERGGTQRTLSIRPEYDADLDRQRLGFSYASRPLNPSVPEAAEISGDFMWRVASTTVSVVVRLFDPEQREQISGVVGGYETTRQAIEFDDRRALTLIGIISLSLAVINLFPFLPLDGGHIFWSLVEKVRGRPVPFSVMERAGVVGFMLVLLLFLVGLTNDIERLSGEGFDVR